MNLTKFNGDTNNIQGLADKPTQSASQLKALFDKIGTDIKTYINEILTTEIDTELGNKANNSDVYSKTETDTLLGNKANNSDVYSKNDVYNKTEINNIRLDSLEIKTLNTNDMNNVTETGIYQVGNNPLTNGPTKFTTWYSLIVIKFSNVFIHQYIYKPVPGELAFREYSGEQTAWRDWKYLSSDVVAKSDFAVLTGTVNFSDSSKVNPLGEYQINYPSGFTVNNCVVISCMIDDNDMYYSTPHSYNSKEQYVILYTNKIALCDKYAYAQQFTHVKYKIVLMKIS